MTYAPEFFINAMQANGMTITKVSAEGVGIIEAQIETKKGTLHIDCGTNGCARILKPNGTVKWVYEKSPAQIHSILKQTIAYNN